MNQAVITGGAGFIGSHLAEELARRGYAVIVLDDLSTGKIENIAGLLTPGDKKKVKFIQGSIRDLAFLREVFQGVDIIFHQAARTGVAPSIEDPLATHEVNVLGTLNVLLAARLNSVKKIVFASSAAVYGDAAAPLREDMLPSPLSPYAVNKLCGEYYCRVFEHLYGLPVVCLRYFNVYGPRQDPNSDYAAVIPRFIARLSNGQSPIIFGSGEQTRDFIFVKDVVVANILAAESIATGVFNVGTGEKVSINQLAALLIQITGKVLEPLHQKAIPGEIKHSWADVSRLRGMDFRPRYTLQYGLQAILGLQGQISEGES